MSSSLVIKLESFLGVCDDDWLDDYELHAPLLMTASQSGRLTLYKANTKSS